MIRDGQIIGLARVQSAMRRKALEAQKVRRMSKQAERDRLVVQMLSERLTQSSSQIAEAHGVSAEYVRVACSRVAHDDLPLAAAELMAASPGLTLDAALKVARQLFYPWSAQ